LFTRQAIPLGVIEGGSLARLKTNRNEQNETAAILSANQTLNKFQEMNNETIDKNLYNGTTNQGPYKEIINQLNQSVPLITGNTLSVSNKSQGNTSSIEKPATLGLLNDTKLPANVKQQNTLLQSSNLKQQRSRIGGGLLGERRTLPVTSDYHNVFIHLRKGSDGGKYRS